MFFKRRNRLFCACRHLGGGGALLRNLSDNSAHSEASLSGQKATENLTPQEQLLAGTLELDPENDPVIFTTDYGLEIRSHNAGMPPVSVTNPNDDPITVNSTEWNYISAGGYNWIIIGSYSESSYTISTIRGDEYSGSNPDGTDAGNSIEDASCNGLLKTNVTIPAFSNAKEGYNGEIPIGCVLCLAATCIDDGNGVTFNPRVAQGNNYKGSNLEKYINETIYAGTSELSLALQDLKIVPQKLTTLYYQSATSTIEDAYLFPLAAIDNTESFFYDTYLDAGVGGSMDIEVTWWLRSGYISRSHDVHGVYSDSNGIVSDLNVAGYYCVRPAFVLQLYSV